MAFGELRRVAMAARCYRWVGISSSGLWPAPLSGSPEVLCFVQSSSAMSGAFEHGMGVGPSNDNSMSWVLQDLRTHTSHAETVFGVRKVIVLKAFER